MVREERSGDLRMQLDVRFRAALMRFFAKRIGNIVEAEDFTQEVFMRLVRAKSLEQANADIQESCDSLY